MLMPVGGVGFRLSKGGYGALPSPRYRLFCYLGAYSWYRVAFSEEKMRRCVCVSVCLSVCLSVYLSVSLSLCLFVCVRRSILHLCRNGQNLSSEQAGPVCRNGQHLFSEQAGPVVKRKRPGVGFSFVCAFFK